MHHVDATAVINAHTEGLLAVSSLRSVRAAQSHAENHGYRIEVVVVLDRADNLTSEVVESWKEKSDTILRVDNGDLGRSRNDAVKRARGRWIAFLDADDLWCETWLAEALGKADGDGRNIVWHPELNILFGRDPHIFRHIDMESSEFDILSLLINNYWTALCMAQRQLLLEIPYPRTRLADQIGFEDWSWNMSVIAHDALHKIVPDTAHLIRMKNMSLVTKTTQVGAIPAPSSLFRRLLLGDSKIYADPTCSDHNRQRAGHGIHEQPGQKCS